MLLTGCFVGYLRFLPVARGVNAKLLLADSDRPPGNSSGFENEFGRGVPACNPGPAAIGGSDKLLLKCFEESHQGRPA
jgi:hypothetical protein